MRYKSDAVKSVHMSRKYDPLSYSEGQYCFEGIQKLATSYFILNLNSLWNEAHSRRRSVFLCYRNNTTYVSKFLRG